MNYTQQQQNIFSDWFAELTRAGLPAYRANPIATTIALGQQLSNRQRVFVDSVGLLGYLP